MMTSPAQHWDWGPRGWGGVRVGKNVCFEGMQTWVLMAGGSGGGLLNLRLGLFICLVHC